MSTAPTFPSAYLVAFIFVNCSHISICLSRCALQTSICLSRAAVIGTKSLLLIVVLGSAIGFNLCFGDCRVLVDFDILGDDARGEVILEGFTSSDHVVILSDFLVESLLSASLALCFLTSFVYNPLVGLSMLTYS